MESRAEGISKHLFDAKHFFPVVKSAMAACIHNIPENKPRGLPIASSSVNNVRDQMCSETGSTNGSSATKAPATPKMLKLMMSKGQSDG